VAVLSYSLTYVTIAVGGTFVLYSPLKRVWQLRKEETAEGNELKEVLVSPESPGFVEASQP
jgi:hypothetical protein